MDFTKLIQKANREKSRIPQTIETTILFNSANITEQIRGRWKFGKSVDGGIIGKYRNNDYEAFKVSINSSASGNVDLTLTGSLGNNLVIRRKGQLQYEIVSTDWKFGEIALKYGVEEFNLDAEQQQELFFLLEYSVLEEFYNNLYFR